MPSSSRSSAPRPRIVSGPPVTITQSYAGLAQVDGPGFEPPDPWVAVNSAFVVQAVNTTVRISNWAGAELLSLPSWALFGLPQSQLASDVRVHPGTPSTPGGSA